MKAFKIISHMLLVVVLLSPAGVYAQSPARVIKMKCEYLENPIGVDEPHPRFTWQMSDTREGAQQTAYQLFVATDSNVLAENKNVYWSTSKITSSLNMAARIFSPLRFITGV
jgi:alpha-L-rhamnosidase